MNWSKAKTILITAFIITNIFLVYMFTSPGTTSEGFSDNRSLSEFLSQRNIFIAPEIIPLGREDMPVLFVHATGAYCAARDLLKREERWQAAGEDDYEYQAVAEAFIKEAGNVFSTAEFSEIRRENDYVKVVFINKASNIKIETSFIICIFKDKYLVDIDCDWLEVIRFHDNPHRTISAAEVLLIFMARKEREGNTNIESMEIIYWLDESVHYDMPVSEDTALPVWKITYNGGEYEYIDAFEHNR